MIFAINDTNQSTNELTNGSVLNTTFLTAAIIRMFSFLIFTYCSTVCWTHAPLIFRYFPVCTYAKVWFALFRCTKRLPGMYTCVSQHDGHSGLLRNVDIHFNWSHPDVFLLNYSRLSSVKIQLITIRGLVKIRKEGAPIRHTQSDNYVMRLRL